MASDGRDYVIVYLQDQMLTAKKFCAKARSPRRTAEDSGTLIAQDPFSYSRPAIAATKMGFTIACERNVAGHEGEL